LNAEQLRHTECETIDVGALERYARPLLVMLEYDSYSAREPANEQPDGAVAGGHD
jgi:hypothetical protein